MWTTFFDLSAKQGHHRGPGTVYRPMEPQNLLHCINGNLCRGRNSRGLDSQFTATGLAVQPLCMVERG